jgi:hypothetical protein
MQAFSIFTKVLCTAHESSHALKHRQGLSRYLVPSTLQAMNWCSAKSRDDRGESRKIVMLSTFLLRLENHHNLKKGNNIRQLPEQNA